VAVKDHSEYFDGIQIAPTPVGLRVPNTVSRSAGTGERSFLAVISESGKPVLDCELNLHQAANGWRTISFVVGILVLVGSEVGHTRMPTATGAPKQLL